MGFWHTHRWHEVQRWFVSPVANAEKLRLSSVDEDLVYHVLNGYTVVELRCDGCGDLTDRVLHGDATKT